MSKENTCLALPPDLSGPWAYTRGDGPVIWATSEDEKQAVGINAAALTLILAGENIRRFALGLAGLRGRELKSAIEFELEDRMGGALADEVICQDRKRTGETALLSIQLRDKLAKTIRHYNLNPAEILIDYDLLGAEKSVKVGERLIKGGVDGFVMAADWAPMLAQADDFEALTPEALFAQFKENLAQHDALDLRAGLGLQAALTAKWQSWAKIAAMAAGVVILPFMLDQFSQARAWSLQAANDKAQAAEIYQRFTGETSGNDAARQVSQRLRAGKTAAGFLDMSAVLFAASADVSGVEIDSLRYDPRQNILQLTFRYPNFDAGAQLEQAVTARGGQLTVGGIRERGDALIGEASFALAGGGR